MTSPTPAAGTFNVSVVIPAYNDAATIGVALDSMLAQTLLTWEAIVVDDGSTDTSAAVVESFVSCDPRIRLVRQPNGGSAAARNTGIRHSRHPWLFFLDADDWIDSTWLARAAAHLAADATLDAVHCGWAHVDSTGQIRAAERCLATGDLFDTFAKRCAFAIHACVIRRTLVEAAGGFDAAFRIAHDWVMWQRIARLGARFGRVPETLAFYRMREGSLSRDPVPLLDDAIRVLDLGHRPDPPLGLPPDAPHAMGRPAAERDEAVMNFVCYTAGAVLARGGDPLPLVAHIPAGVVPDEPRCLGESIAQPVPLVLERSSGVLLELWPRIAPPLAAFLAATESRTGARGLARAIALGFDQAILASYALQTVCTLAATHVHVLDVTSPIEDVRVEAHIERLHLIVRLQGVQLGRIELPACGVVPASVLRDAVADRFAWQVLEKFFDYGVYRSLAYRRDADGWSAWRGDRCLARDLPEEPAERSVRLRDTAGWDLFLEEVWGPPSPPEEREAAPGLTSRLREALRRVRLDTSPRWTRIEVSGPVREVRVDGVSALVEVTVGGVPIAAIEMPADGGRVAPDALRSAVTDALGYELCRVAIREALLGRPLDDGSTLRERLTRLASTARSMRHGIVVRARDAYLAPGWEAAASAAMPDASAGVVVARRLARPLGTSASRKAVLPWETVDVIRNAEAHAGTPTLDVKGDGPGTVVYAPELLWLPRSGTAAGRAPVESPIDAEHRQASPDAGAGARFEFDALFAERADPWSYSSAYEQTKYEQTLSLLPPGPIARALEIGCAEGHFTRQLAPLVGRLAATDISDVALEGAADRCRNCHNVEFRRLDLVRDPLPRGFDLIVCSEMLYYVGGRDELQRAAEKLVSGLAPGGHLLTTHANVLVDDPGRTGFDWDVPFGAETIVRSFRAIRGLELVRELRTPLYRIALFRASDGSPGRTPEIVETDQVELPVDRIAASIRWGGRVGARRPAAPMTTERLPILMYHRVAPTGGAERDRYRMTPDVFECQLRYLRDCGFRSIGLDEWRRATAARRPIEGRAVMITFDDAFRDFEEYAFPLLERYGFGATVFVVTDSVGRWNEWDRDGNAEPVLDWPAILRLRDRGVTFGAHSMTHARLTSLSPADVVRQVIGSRSALEYRLGTPVTAFAYPYGQNDEAIQHLVGACGFVYGMTC
ncbi:MAG: glycosyltransferase, partial [Gemmatimonadaceae bacterium]